MRARFVNEKFTEKSDPIKDMGIGSTFVDDNGDQWYKGVNLTQPIDYQDEEKYPTIEDAEKAISNQAYLIFEFQTKNFTYTSGMKVEEEEFFMRKLNSKDALRLLKKMPARTTNQTQILVSKLNKEDKIKYRDMVRGHPLKPRVKKPKQLKLF